MGKVTLVIVLSLLGMNETGRSADSVRVPNGYVNLASEASAKDETARRIAAESLAAAKAEADKETAKTEA